MDISKIQIEKDRWTSYIPTTSGPVTRPAETVSLALVDGENFNDQQGTVEVTFIPTPGSEGSALTLRNTAFDTYLAVGHRKDEHGFSLVLRASSPTSQFPSLSQWARDANISDNLALTINTDLNESPNPGEGVLSGIVNGEPDFSVDGFIYWQGEKISVPRESFAGSIYTFFTGETSRTFGHLAFDTAKTGAFPTTAVGGGNMNVAFVRRDNAVTSGWVYDDNTEWTEFTPTDAMVSLGTMDAGGDDIYAASLWGFPIKLTDAPEPTAVYPKDRVAACKVRASFSRYGARGSINGMPVGHLKDTKMFPDGSFDILQFGNSYEGHFYGHIRNFQLRARASNESELHA